MNVAILGIKQIPAYAGADRVVEQLLTFLPQQHEYYVYVVKNHDGRDPRCSNNIHFIAIPALKGKHLRALSYFFLSTMHFLLKGRYDLAHVHNSDFGFFCPFLKLKNGIKVVGTFHGDPYLRDKWGFFAKLYFRISEYLFVAFCDVVTTVSKQKTLARVEPLYIPNGVDRSALGEPGGIPPSLGVKDGQYILFACGRLDATKGLHHLVRAYQEGSFEFPLLVIGDFSHDANYSRHIESMVGDDDRIILHKQLIDKDALLSVMRHSRLFVFPSEIEAMSMILLEAVACRVKIVCSDIEENLEIVGKDFQWRFSSADHQDLRLKMRLALDDPSAAAIIDAVYDRCVTHFDWHHIAGRYHQVYNSVMQPAMADIRGGQ